MPGLPDTSGIPQVDYFLSSDVCEADRADAHYTERLIRSPSLLTWQQRMQVPAQRELAADFGVGSEPASLSVSAQNRKVSSRLRRACRATSCGAIRDGMLVIPKDAHGYAARKLQNRLRMALPHVIERIRFVPYQSMDGYLRLHRARPTCCSTRIHYGGGLTSFDGLSLNKPIVTLPGPFVRGRYTLGFYRTMGVDRMHGRIGRRLRRKSRALGTDREWRMHVGEPDQRDERRDLRIERIDRENTTASSGSLSTKR